MPKNKTEESKIELKVGDALLYDASTPNATAKPTYYKVYIERIVEARNAVLITSGRWITIDGANHYRNLFLNVEKKYLKYISREYFSNESNFEIPIPDKIYPH